MKQLARPSEQRQNPVTPTVYTTSPCTTRENIPPAAAALRFPSCSPHTAGAMGIRTSLVTIFQRHPVPSKSREEPSKSYRTGPSYFFPSACSAQETQKFLQGMTDQVPPPPRASEHSAHPCGSFSLLSIFSLDSFFSVRNSRCQHPPVPWSPNIAFQYFIYILHYPLSLPTR